MGNNHDTISIIPLLVNERMHDFFIKADMSLDIVNMMDFFPMVMEKRIATETTISNLDIIAKVKTNNSKIWTTNNIKGRNNRNNLNKRILVLSNEDRIKVIEEELLSLQLVHIIEYANSRRHTNCDIYYFIDKSTMFIDHKLLIKLITYPKVNSLLASVKLNNTDLVTKYIYMFDPRRNNMEIYYSSLKSNGQVQNLVKNSMLLRNFLEKQVFSKISVDIWRYYMLSNIIHV